MKRFAIRDIDLGISRTIEASDARSAERIYRIMFCAPYSRIRVILY